MLKSTRKTQYTLNNQVLILAPQDLEAAHVRARIWTAQIVLK